MYKIETHLHTSYVSQCARLEAEHLAAAYHAAGFSGIAVTDHYNIETYAYMGRDPKSDKHASVTTLQGYWRMQEACAKYGIKVYCGLELRFYENVNDYLYYDFDPALLDDAHAVMSLGVAGFREQLHPLGGLLIQAHPFRYPCVPVAAHLLDGVEVLNCNPRHNSNNTRALDFAARNPQLIRTAGSDCHQLGDEAVSGILSETLPADTKEFAALLRSGAYQLLAEERNPPAPL